MAGANLSKDLALDANEDLSVIVSEKSDGLVASFKHMNVDENFRTSHSPEESMVDASVVFGQSEIQANESEF